MRRTLIVLIRGYQWFISPMKMTLLGPLARCRYMPTCSEYAVGAIQEHGVVNGGFLAVKRLCRCHPWGGSGYDPVPGSMEKRR